MCTCWMDSQKTSSSCRCSCSVHRACLGRSSRGHCPCTPTSRDNTLNLLRSSTASRCLGLYCHWDSLELSAGRYVEEATAREHTALLSLGDAVESHSEGGSAHVHCGCSRHDVRALRVVVLWPGYSAAAIQDKQSKSSAAVKSRQLNGVGLN